MSTETKLEPTKEAQIEQKPEGLRPAEPGWFILNAREAVWFKHEKFGSVAHLEGGAAFSQAGINIRMLQPGQPNCYYHRESNQEDFLVLSGQCVVLIEGQERPLKAWDFVHCPTGTAHVFVGTGTEPCLLLMMGVRTKDSSIQYPVEPLALKHDAGVKTETFDPKEAYAGLTPRQPVQAPAVALELLRT